ncbi:gypsy/ty3 retroelement polyprotein [Tanacetum coccineum]
MRNQANKHRTYRQFKVHDWVYLKLHPHRQVLKLPSSSQIHLLFHISQLKKCHGKYHSIGVLPHLREDGLLENKPMAILEKRLGKVNNKPVMFVLIQWTNKPVKEATWEIYGDLITRFPGTLSSLLRINWYQSSLPGNSDGVLRAHSTDIDNLKKGARTSQPRTNELTIQQRQHLEPNNTPYRKLIRIEFPKFSGDDMKDWVYSLDQQYVKGSPDNTLCKHFEVEVVKRFRVLYDDHIMELKNLKQTGSVQNYQEAFEALLNKVDLPEPIAKSMFIRGLKPKVGTPMRMFQANNLSGSYQLARMQEGLGDAGSAQSSTSLTRHLLLL